MNTEHSFLNIASSSSEEGDSDEVFSVGEFLDAMNASFSGMRVVLRGEISGTEERRGVTYFSLKDSESDALLSCLIFRNDFADSLSEVTQGSEVIVEGTPNIWKPRGRFSFRVYRLRIAGEGALKKAYDALRERLDRAGIFDPEKKRSLPAFPQKIALLTSREGAAMGDFAANLRQHGFSVSLFDAHVEGRYAVSDLLEGIRFFHRSPESWDVLVLIRGGGSLESLQAYNNEHVVRAIAESKIPTLAGIGHEKDISLAALACDAMVSTPTAAAAILGASREYLREQTTNLEHVLFDRFRDFLFDGEERIRTASDRILSAREGMASPLRNLFAAGERLEMQYAAFLDKARFHMLDLSREFMRSFRTELISQKISDVEARIESRNPYRLLERGYALLYRDGHVVRDVATLKAGDRVETKLASGDVRSTVTHVFASGRTKKRLLR
ncbi:MAG: exodeoxyribonuclease VII large subunit [Candidatus Moraniibacteriota bacterium]|nr:MAG: exodeoxyribonuclease VII large subunit [Candidatus Moranbacteria bacterium]